MTKQPLTYKEGDKYYAVVYTADGHSFYIGSYPDRSAARKRALIEKSQSELITDYQKHLSREINLC